MKIQSLAVIFIIIILPISMILTSYVQSQVKTLSLQTEYDTKLNNATYDALKAFQINTINSDSSDLANSKLRDINASVNSFFDSIATNFNMAGYNKDILKDYVPALVYTMYDGYYIYSPFKNRLDDTNSILDETTGETKSDAEILSPDNTDATYKEDDRITGLKPYIHYSCRYINNSDDFVITYSLDNYITIQGNISGESVSDAGYLIDLDNIREIGGKIYYREVEIKDNEELSEYVIYSGISEPKSYPYIKINGVKYYKDPDTNGWFTIMNGVRYDTQEKFNEKSIAAKKYYKAAYEFTRRMEYEYHLIDNYNFTGANAVETSEDGNPKPIYEKDDKGQDIEGQYKFGDYPIFREENHRSIEDPDSNFNQQRLAVIRYSIEKNLSTAIANYNNMVPNNPANFQMPKLKEDEWDKILNNISIISFLQGLNIGGKVYNGYSIIPNNKNKEVVTEDSIYIINKSYNQYYHKPTCGEIRTSLNPEEMTGLLNIDLEIKSGENSDGNTIYYNPHQRFVTTPYTGCYSCIVTGTGVGDTDNLLNYKSWNNGLSEGENELIAREYYTALGRERYSMYKSNNNIDEMKKDFLIP